MLTPSQRRDLAHRLLTAPDHEPIELNMTSGPASNGHSHPAPAGELQLDPGEVLAELGSFDRTTLELAMERTARKKLQAQLVQAQHDLTVLQQALLQTQSPSGDDATNKEGADAS